MTKPNSTEIIAIIDRSGSMQSIASDMEGGFDSFIADQRKLAGECRVTLVRFDDEYLIDYTAKPIAEVGPLKISPRGSTALLDAIGRTIVATGERLAAMPEHDRPSQVIVLIVTDGQENASREFGRSAVAELIKQQTRDYAWSFTYFGANQDAIAVGASLNIPKASSVTFEATARGARASAVALSRSVASARTGGPVRDTTEVYLEAYNAADAYLNQGE